MVNPCSSFPSEMAPSLPKYTARNPENNTSPHYTTRRSHNGLTRDHYHYHHDHRHSRARKHSRTCHLRDHNNPATTRSDGRRTTCHSHNKSHANSIGGQADHHYHCHGPR